MGPRSCGRRSASRRRPATRRNGPPGARRPGDRAVPGRRCAAPPNAGLGTRRSIRAVPRASFERLPAKPDHPRLELEVLELWEQRGTFERVRERNRGGPRWSFIDGPVTANKILAVHTAWGRTLKDVFQRYRAMRGFDQRYQNGFDCQGLWIEVGVERELGFNSKREIESYGLAEFARRCREKVVWSAEELTRGSKRLGQWMDWGDDYFTFSDTNIEYIWRFLKIVHERGWLYTRPTARPSGARAAGRRSPSTSCCRPTSTATAPTRRSSSASRCATGRASRWSCGRRRRGRCRRTSRRPSTPTPSTSCATAASGSPAPATTTAPSTPPRPAASSSASPTTARSTTSRPPPASSTGSSRGTRSASRRAPASSTSRRAAAARTSSCRRRSGSTSSRRSTRPAASSRTTAGSTGAGRARSPTRSSPTSPSAGGSSPPRRSSTATRTAGAARRR